MTEHHTERDRSETPNRCIGVTGRIFGHRFTVNIGEYAYRVDYCGRCGRAAEVCDSSKEASA